MAREVKNPESKRRYRSGCWICREKKIRCDERKPSCTSCEKSHRRCYYGIKLLWQDEADSRGIALGRSGTCKKLKRKRRDDRRARTSIHAVNHFLSVGPVEDWMFLNTDTVDFELGNMEVARTREKNNSFHRSSSPSSEMSTQSWIESPISSTNYGASPRSVAWSADIESRTPERRYSIETEHPFIDYTGALRRLSNQPSSSFSVPLSPALFDFSPTEGSLLDYFQTQLATWCRGFGARNPYSTIILRLTFGTGSTMLLQAVLAASANQLRILNDLRFHEDVWIHRGKALKALHARIQECKSRDDWSGWEVSDKCSSSWRSHLDFARKLRSLPQLSSQRLSIDQEGLLHFFSCYFHSHEAVASTAAECGKRGLQTTSWFPPEIDMEDINSDAGVSHELLSLISLISDLGQERATLDAETYQSRIMLAKIQSQRDTIERRLHNLTQNIPSSSSSSYSSSSNSELTNIASCKRLVTLLYLHFRLDSSTPSQPHIIRLTSQILSLLPKIGVWSNTILWPLYIVGVMGIQSERDEDKLVVLERFEALQRTRQLGNVKRARRVVEAIWRLRDIRGSEGVGWEDVQGIVLRDGGQLSLM
ncbi:uncharacterized protein PAC_07727 [Phialocephala subalpina]|uniref:Zn(2)-C6 fungal-type domain-containing protein n=1 Tax=Phialocephala subalpina TaxID=576137 RepID=A0A1L7WYI5_9HELO|nr:uncharacterized protein PAC_07727 [Phialocephala subalpina]